MISVKGFVVFPKGLIFDLMNGVVIVEIRAREFIRITCACTNDSHM